MKKQLKYSIFLFLVILGVALSVNASGVEPKYIWNYSITAKHNWVAADEMNGNTKTNDNNFSVVNWTKSTQSGSHNMWYRVVNSNASVRAVELIPYKSRREMPSTAQRNYYYYLEGRRENAVDPRTTVKGTWNP